MSERLATSVEVGALLRQADVQGGFGAVLRKGDPERGSILLVLVERGAHAAFLERMLQGDGAYRWARSGPADPDPSTRTQYVGRRRRADPDCWVVELDIPSAERFIAETMGVA